MKDNHGFRLIKDEYSDDIDSQLYLFEHIKSGARLMAIKNDDINRVFMIGFRTPSNNSTGVAHIMEHSTLCGSEKYPVKEPFVELIKGSLNTFLNAMTYADKTVYPVASTNKADFRNLTDVYLDAVFHPNIYQNPYTFMQEGWHYHLENEEEPIKYNGVVYNEMKGAFSDPSSLIERESFKALFPDTIYGQESGGDPDIIPELTYSDFLDFHDKFYHPSNSYIYLYGDNDLDEQLEYLDKWLEPYDKKEIDSEIALQEPLKERVEAEFSYPVSPGASTENADMMALNIALNPDLDSTQIRALGILFDILLENNSSVLKKALLDKNLAGEVQALFDVPMRQPVFMIILKNTDRNKKEEFIKTVEEVLNDLVENGLNPEDLQARINNSEFHMLEALSGEGTGSYPKGLPMGLVIMENWLYEKDPFERLDISRQFEEIKELKENGGFEKLLKEHILENPHQALITLTPDENLIAQREERLNQKLEDYKKSLTDEELKALVDTTKKLIEAQNEVDTPEELATIPHITVSEIERKRSPINYELLDLDGVPVIYVDQGSKDIIYLKLNFDVTGISGDDLVYLSLLENLIGYISTKNLDFETLTRQIDMYTGNLSPKIHIYENVNNQELIPVFSYQVAMRAEFLKQALSLLEEVAQNGLFTEKEIIRKLIEEDQLHHKSIIQNHGNGMASLRARAQFSDQARIGEELEGIEYYKFLTDVVENFEERWPVLSEKLAELAQKILNKQGMTVSLACKKEYLNEVLEALSPIIQKLEEKPRESGKMELKKLTPDEAFITSGNVMYNAEAGLIKDIDSINRGALMVLKTILSMDYLWNQVRVQGGAYGTGFNFNRNGEVFMSSFRDPNLEKTYANFDGILDYINSLDLTQDDIDKYIIGTISPMDVPRSAKGELNLAQSMYYTGRTEEERQLARDQVLSTTLEDLKKNAQILEEALEDKAICTIGTESAIKASKDLFKDIEYVK